MKNSISSGTSSRRSARDGTRIGIDAEAMEQVLAEAAGGDLGRQIAARGRDDAHIHMDAGRAADALEVLVHENAQDPVLRLPRHVGDLVDVERAAMRLFEGADAASPARRRSRCRKARPPWLSGVIVAAESTTKGPLARVERLWMVRAVSSLPDPGRAGDQDARIGRGGPLDRLPELVDRRSDRAGDAARLDGAGAQVAHLALEAGRLERALGHEHEPIRLERLLDEVVGAGLDGRDGCLDVAVARRSSPPADPDAAP